MQILEARCIGISFNQFEYSEGKTDIDKILLRGAGITGAPLPTTEFFADIISNEVFLFITQFGYGDYTLAEVLLSLRINSKGGMMLPSGTRLVPIEFYGHCFNVDFLSKVLYNYSLLRGQLDRKIENHLDKVAE
jgi:hypothetical protein